MDGLRRKLESQKMKMLLPLAEAVELDLPRRPRKADVIEAFLQKPQALPSMWTELVVQEAPAALNIQATEREEHVDMGQPGEQGDIGQREGAGPSHTRGAGDTNGDEDGDSTGEQLQHDGNPSYAAASPVPHAPLTTPRPIVPKWDAIKTLDRRQAQMLLQQLELYGEPVASDRTLRRLRQRALGSGSPERHSDAPTAQPEANPARPGRE